MHIVVSYFKCFTLLTGYYGVYCVDFVFKNDFLTFRSSIPICLFPGFSLAFLQI
jgi:hypothetical protein